MKMSLFFIYFLVSILLVSTVSAFSLTIDLNEYSPLETITVILSCDFGNERNQAYNVTWTNSTDIVEVDSGVTPSNCQIANFFEEYTIPADASYNNGKINITGTNLKGEVFYNVTKTTTGSIRVVNIEFSQDSRIGKTTGVKWEVVDSLDSKVSNAYCDVHLEDSTGFHLKGSSNIAGAGIRTFDEMGVLGIPLDVDSLQEDTQYAVEIHCICGLNGTTDTCFTQSDATLDNVGATTEATFRVGKWADVNTVTDKSSYTLDDEQIKICANITNNDTTRARSYNIKYDLRCNGESNQSLNNVLLDVHEEERVLDAGQTQTQCALLDLNNIKTVQNKLNTCLARTHVIVLDDDHETPLIEYDTKSDIFNFTSDSNIFTEEKDTMASLSITIFSLLLPLILFFLFMKKDLVPIKTAKSQYINLLARRSCLAIAVYLMMMNAGIMATIAGAGDLDILKEMFLYMQLYGWAGYSLLIIIVFKTLTDLMESWKDNKKKEQFGND